MKFLTIFVRGLLVALAALSAEDGWSQRVRFPSAADTTVAQGPTAAPAWTAPALPPPSAGTPSAGATLNPGIQPFDPYASAGPPPPLSPPGTQPPVWTAPPGGAPSSLPPPYYPYGTPAAPDSAFPPQQPSSLFPQGVPQNQWGVTSGPPYERLFQNTGFGYTFLAGSDRNQLQMNDVDISTTLAFQFFSHSGQGLRLTPGFTFHFLDGPQPPLSTNTNLPARLYDVYLDSQWNPRLTQQFSLELNFRTGVYSDFNTVTTDSVRFMGTGLAVLQMSPTLAFKLGASYLDRLEIKILPAGGLVWEPNQQTKFEFIFPTPRLAQYWKTVGNADVWWYLGGEYGAGNWTIERLNGPAQGFTDRIDINDIRFFGGLEWHGLRKRVAFFEVGYVFEREIVFYLVSRDNLKLEDTYMLRAGFHF